MLLDNFLRYITSEKRFSKLTAEAYQNDLYQFADFVNSTFEITDLTQVDSTQIRSFIVSLKDKEFENKSINRKLSCLRTFYKYVVRESLMDASPMLSIRSLKQPKNIAKFVPLSDIEKVEFDTLDDSFSILRDQIIFEILYQTGMRQAELGNLNDVDIDFYLNQIKVVGKRNKERLVPIDINLIKLIKHYQEVRNRLFENKERYFLLSNKGVKVSKNLIYRSIHNTLLKSTTLKQKSPHVMRHTCATQLLNEGADLLAIKELLGHSSLSSTQIYTHNTIEQLKKIYKQAHPKG